MQLSKGDIIADGENRFSVFAILGKTIYVEPRGDVKGRPGYDIQEVLKYYRRIELMKR